MHNRLGILALVLAILCEGILAAEIESTSPIEPVVVGCSLQKDPEVVGDSTPKEPIVVGCSIQKDPLVVGDSTPKESIVLECSLQKDPEVVGDSTPKESIVLECSLQKDPLVVGDNTPKESTVVGCTLQKDPLVVGDNTPKEPIVVGCTLQKDPIVVGDGTPKEPIVVGGGTRRDSRAHESATTPKKTTDIRPINPSRSDSSLGIKMLSGFNFRRSDSGNFNSITSGLLNDTYLLEGMMDEVLIDVFANQSGYYKKSEIKFGCTIQELVNLFGNGLQSDIIPEDPGCGRKAAYAEWLLERHGISANIIVAPNFFGKNGHAWVEIPAPNNETYYIDLSRGQNYIVNEEEFRLKDTKNNIKYNYWRYNDVYSACRAFGLKKFAWWWTEWGVMCLKIHNQ